MTTGNALVTGCLEIVNIELMLAVKPLSPAENDPCLTAGHAKCDKITVMATSTDYKHVHYGLPLWWKIKTSQHTGQAIPYTHRIGAPVAHPPAQTQYTGS